MLHLIDNCCLSHLKHLKNTQKHPEVICNLQLAIMFIEVYLSSLWNFELRKLKKNHFSSGAHKSNLKIKKNLNMNYSRASSSETTAFHICMSLSLFKHTCRISKNHKLFLWPNLILCEENNFSCWIYHAEIFFEFILVYSQFIIAKILATNSFRKLFKIMQKWSRKLRNSIKHSTRSPFTWRLW